MRRGQKMCTCSKCHCSTEIPVSRTIPCAYCMLGVHQTRMPAHHEDLSIHAEAK